MKSIAQQICIPTYLSCKEGADAIDARVDSAGNVGAELYFGRLEDEERLERSGSRAGRGDGARTSMDGVVLFFGLSLRVGEESLCVALKCDMLSKGPETDAVIAVGRGRRGWYYEISIILFLRTLNILVLAKNGDKLVIIDSGFFQHAIRGARGLAIKERRAARKVDRR